MKPSDLHRLLDEILASGRDAEQVGTLLRGLLKHNLAEPTALTIIANAGVHEIPDAYLRGEVYEASRGNWDVSTEEALSRELTVILSRLVNKLRSRRWSCVYLIPTGHPILSLQIKAMVYQLLRFNTIDLYHKGGTYLEVNLDQRAIAIATGHRVGS